MFLRRHRHVGRIRIDASPERVWAVIRPAETGPVLDPRCVEAWSEAPAGPGGREIQVHVLLEQGVRLRMRSVIVEEEPARFARTEVVSAMREDLQEVIQVGQAGSEFRLEPLPDGGTRFVHVSWHQSRQLLRPAAEIRVQEVWEQEYLRRTKELSESGERLPVHPPG